VTRFFDRGAIVAAYVGIGMAITIAVSFLLVIPIEPIVWYLMAPAGVMIGYYANQRSDRRAGPWPRILTNAVFAGVATGLTIAFMLLGVKAIFFAADNGYPDFNRVDANRNPIPPLCESGADCVYQRYVADGRGPDLLGFGVTDADSFTPFYWGQQLTTAGVLLGFATIGGLTGGVLYGVFRPKSGARSGTTTAPEPGH
jgi:hypothetical protein